MVTRLTVIQRVAPHLGGYVGTIGSGSTATAVVLSGLIDTKGDDTIFVDGQLLLPDEAAADQERRITAWDDSAGTATVGTIAGGAPASGENYVLLPRDSFTLQEIRDAINDALRTLKRSQRHVIPTISGERHYYLRALDWLRSEDDVDAVLFRASPNLLDNEHFVKWQNGPSAAPDGYVLAGAGASVARDATLGFRGPYGATLTRAGADATLRYTLPPELVYHLVNRTGGPATLSLSALVYAASASPAVTVGIRRRVGGFYSTTSSSAHGSNPDLAELTVSLALTTSMDDVAVEFSVATSDGAATILAAYLVDGSSVPAELTTYGSDRFSTQPVAHEPFNIGSPGGVISLASAKNAGGQLVLSTRRPFATLSADSGQTDCPEELLVAQTLYELASLHKPGQDRERLDRLAQIHGAAATQLGRKLIDRPRDKSQRRVMVGGA